MRQVERERSEERQKKSEEVFKMPAHLTKYCISEGSTSSISPLRVPYFMSKKYIFKSTLHSDI
jgi:hypothetical protein